MSSTHAQTDTDLDTLLLVGSLSNDLFRVASLTQRGSTTAAVRFLREAKRWAKPLRQAEVADYIRRIAAEVTAASTDDLSLAQAERHLMHGVLLQNYALHLKKEQTNNNGQEKE